MLKNARLQMLLKRKDLLQTFIHCLIHYIIISTMYMQDGSWKVFKMSAYITFTKYEFYLETRW